MGNLLDLSGPYQYIGTERVGLPLTGRSTSRSAFVQVVGLLNTYLPLTVMVFVIIDNVKWFTATDTNYC